MTRLRLLAPATVGLFTSPGATQRDPLGYAEFWKAQQEAIAADPIIPADTPDTVGPPTVRFEHQVQTTGFNRYQTIDKDALERPHQLITAVFSEDHFTGAVSAPLAARFGPHILELSCRVYDHGIFLFEVLLAVDDLIDFDAPQQVAAQLDTLQEQAIALGTELATACHDRYLVPLLDRLLDADTDGVYVDEAPGEDDGTGFVGGHVHWVTRSLVLDQATARTEPFLRHWIKDAITANEDVAEPADQLMAGEIRYLTRWLNYLFVEPDQNPGRMLDTFHDEWQSMRYAQYFYAALEGIGNQLALVLAESLVASGAGQVSQLRNNLEQLSRRAQLIIMELHDLSRYLKRSIRAGLDAILEGWDFQRLIEEPVLYKVQVCEQRLADLAAKRAARSTLFTDLILLSIGVTSILGTALGVTEFGRMMAADPGLAGYDVTSGDATTWFASQPSDAILLGSGVVSLLLVALYFFFRRSQSA